MFIPELPVPSRDMTQRFHDASHHFRARHSQLRGGNPDVLLIAISTVRGSHNQNS